jgi:hypothetical protein
MLHEQPGLRKVVCLPVHSTIKVCETLKKQESVSYVKTHSRPRGVATRRGTPLQPLEPNYLSSYPLDPEGASALRHALLAADPLVLRSSTHV